MRSFIAVTLVMLAPLLSGQGRGSYLNVETPQVKPITVARVGGRDFILICNTPDNSVEVWDTNEAIPSTNRFLLRIPVGIEPCSIAWSALHSRFFTTDFLGDSITSVTLTSGGATAPPTFVVNAVKNVGDEPVHLVLVPPNDSMLAVSFMSSHTVGWFDPTTLAPIVPAAPATVTAATGATWALREPRNLVVDNGAVHAIGHKGGHTNKVGNHYDFDLARIDPTNGTVTAWTGRLGSTNSGLAAGVGGDLYVVGGLGRNEVKATNFGLQAPFGFVESQLHVIRQLGQPGQQVLTRNLNAELVGAINVPVNKNVALANPTDVMPFVAGGVVTKVFVAAFSSDRIGVVVPDFTIPASAWTIRRIDLHPGTLGLLWGPRAMAFKSRTTTLGHRIYILNRIDHSFAILDPVNEVILDRIALKLDPTPAHIRAGRPFLYDAHLSNNGFVSCASCHNDGRTDSMQWDLGSPTGFVAPFQKTLADGPLGATITEIDDLVTNGFDPDKGPMITQSLQGLLNFEVDPTSMGYVTNAPYHWRGDRADFTEFNEGFANLLGLGNGFPNGNGVPGGIPLGDIKKMEEFINSIHYPPNPHQPANRVYSGALGNPNNTSDPAASGAKRGLKAYHIAGLGRCNGRSCVQCHSLFEGSNNKVTCMLGLPLETPATRGLLQKEARLDTAAGSAGSIHLGSTQDSAGLARIGSSLSLNAFIEAFQLGTEDLPVKQFAREFDWGVAPIVGWTRSTGNPASVPTLTDIATMEGQAKAANAGIAVRVQLQTTRRGFAYDPIQNAYVEETAAGPGQVLSLNALLNLLAPVSTDLAVFHSVPLGSERRVAAPSGVTGPLAASSLTGLRFVGLRPNTAYREVPQMTANWVPGAPPGFNWTHPSLPTPLSLHAIRLLQHALLQAPDPFGLSGLRHDAPRRLRIAGNGIQPGAVLLVRTPEDPTGAPPNTGALPDPNKTRLLTFTLYPTNELFLNRPVWETSVELEPVVYYRMMVGGPFTPAIVNAFADFDATISEPPPAGMFDPTAHNWHYISIQNPGQTPVRLGWQRLRLE